MISLVSRERCHNDLQQTRIRIKYDEDIGLIIEDILILQLDDMTKHTDFRADLRSAQQSLRKNVSERSTLATWKGRGRDGFQFKYKQVGMVLFAITSQRNFKLCPTLRASLKHFVHLTYSSSFTTLLTTPSAHSENMGMTISRVLHSILGKREMRKFSILLGFQMSL